MSPVDPSEIIEAARECKGTVWKHQARIPGVALDCAGLLVHIFKRVGVPFNDERGYSRVPHHDIMRGILDAQPSLLVLNRREYEAGDVLLMRYKIEPQHIAVFTGEGIVHASCTHRKCVEHRLGRDVLKVMRAYRIVRP